jgi:DAACS family dicarboxylate/amino acid:cation (Na+ or H+) symporter
MSLPALPSVAALATPIGQAFVWALVAAAVPLGATSLALALGNLELRSLGRMGARLLALSAGSSVIAASIGLLLVTTVGPGRGLDRALLPAASGAPLADAPPLVRALLAALLLALLAGTVATGLALHRLPPDRSARLLGRVTRLHDLAARGAALAMKAAPLGVAALLVSAFARMGGGAFRPVAAYVGVVVGGLLLHGGLVYALAVRFLGGMSPVAFFRGARRAMLTAFSTASSAATLPTALDVAENALRLPPAAARLVLTAGSAMNQNGTSLYEGVTVLFLAQLAGVELSLAQQAGAMAVSVLAGIGSAGVPGGGSLAIVTVLGLLGVPMDGLGLVLGVDRLLDMCRTTVNVLGDLVIAVIVARGFPDRESS